MAVPGRHKEDDRLAALIAAGNTAKAAAVEAKVSERTALRRMADPEFRARVAAIRGDIMTAALGRLTDGMGDAAEVLRGLLAEPDPDVRHRAAVKVIELAVRVRDQTEMAERLARVEALLAGDTDRAGPVTDPTGEARGGGTAPGGPAGSDPGTVPGGPRPADD